MRALTLLLCCLPLPATAQDGPVFEGVVGACMVENDQGTLTSAGTCKKLPVNCTPVACALVFEWYTGSRTVVTTETGQTPFANAGVLVNGQPAGTPAALRQSDPRDCIYNENSGNTFCFVEGVDALTEVGDETNTDIARLKDIARALPPGWRGEGPEEIREITQTASPAPVAKASPLLAPFEGVWKAEGSTSCSPESDLRLQIAEGQARFYESICVLSQPRPATEFGAVEVLGLCSGEGSLWEEPMLMHRVRDRIALLNDRTMMIYEACD